MDVFKKVFLRIERLCQNGRELWLKINHAVWVSSHIYSRCYDLGSDLWDKRAQNETHLHKAQRLCLCCVHQTPIDLWIIRKLGPQHSEFSVHNVFLISALLRSHCLLKKVLHRRFPAIALDGGCSPTAPPQGLERPRKLWRRRRSFATADCIRACAPVCVGALISNVLE